MVRWPTTFRAQGQNQERKHFPATSQIMRVIFIVNDNNTVISSVKIVGGWGGVYLKRISEIWINRTKDKIVFSFYNPLLLLYGFNKLRWVINWAQISNFNIVQFAKRRDNFFYVRWNMFFSHFGKTVVSYRQKHDVILNNVFVWM